MRPTIGRNGYVCNFDLCDRSRSVKVELTVRAHAGRGGIRGWDATAASPSGGATRPTTLGDA
ncbi:hypothetical protein SMG44B_70003 [Stenotrophomonas maltophilia]|nr:hypothetical protein BN1263260039 [Stenotrophomonas maltophilia]